MPNIDPVNFSMLTVYFFSALAGAMAYGCARTLCRQDGYIDLFDRFTLDGATPRYSFAEPIEALSITIPWYTCPFFFSFPVLVRRRRVEDVSWGDSPILGASLYALLTAFESICVRIQ